MKHNKKRNSALLYEILVRALTSAIVKEDTHKKREVLRLIKESFNKRTMLNRDLGCYKQLIDSTKEKNTPSYASELLEGVKKEKQAIDEKQLFSEQSKLIAAMNKSFGMEIFNTFVPNYKSLASIYQIFNIKTTTKKRLVLESKLKEHISSDEESKEELSPIDSLSYRTFVSKFNGEYSKGLLKEQRELVNHYVTSFSDNALELKMFLNEEVGRLKTEIKESLELPEVSEDPEMTRKTGLILEKIEGYKTQEITPGMMESILKMQQLVHEVKSDGN